jgi:hypothetical protein
VAFAPWLTSILLEYKITTLRVIELAVPDLAEIGSTDRFSIVFLSKPTLSHYVRFEDYEPKQFQIIILYDIPSNLLDISIVPTTLAYKQQVIYHRQ